MSGDHGVATTLRAATSSRHTPINPAAWSETVWCIRFAPRHHRTTPPATEPQGQSPCGAYASPRDTIAPHPLRPSRKVSHRVVHTLRPATPSHHTPSDRAARSATVWCIRFAPRHHRTTPPPTEPQGQPPCGAYASPRDTIAPHPLRPSRKVSHRVVHTLRPATPSHHTPSDRAATSATVWCIRFAPRHYLATPRSRSSRPPPCGAYASPRDTISPHPAPEARGGHGVVHTLRPATLSPHTPLPRLEAATVWCIRLAPRHHLATPRSPSSRRPRCGAYASPRDTISPHPSTRVVVAPLRGARHTRSTHTHQRCSSGTVRRYVAPLWSGPRGAPTPARPDRVAPPEEVDHPCDHPTTARRASSLTRKSGSLKAQRTAQWAVRVMKKPAASYSPGPLRAKYHRR